MNENTILHTVPAADELHKVPGFDPMKHLHRTVNAEGEPVMRLEPRYQRLWFRLACPKGRMLLNPLRITDQLAIFEAKVFFHRDDATPASSFTSNKTARETPNYIRAAQDEALKEALDNAGFGIQLCDVTQAASDSSAVTPPVVQLQSAATNITAEPMSKPGPLPQYAVLTNKPKAATVTESASKTAPAPQTVVQTDKPEVAAVAEPAPKPAPAPQTVVQTDKPEVAAVTELAPKPAPAPQPVAQTDKLEDTAAEPAPQPAPAPQPTVQAEELNALSTVSKEAVAPTDGQPSAQAALLNFPALSEKPSEAQEKPAADTVPVQAQDSSPSAVAYTSDMPVEEICKLMTMDEAKKVVVTKGTCNGWTMGQVAEKRPSSLRFYLSGFGHCDNIQLAAATLLTQGMDQKKAG